MCGYTHSSVTFSLLFASRFSSPSGFPVTEVYLSQQDNNAPLPLSSLGSVMTGGHAVSYMLCYYRLDNSV